MFTSTSTYVHMYVSGKYITMSSDAMIKNWSFFFSFCICTYIRVIIRNYINEKNVKIICTYDAFFS